MAVIKNLMHKVNSHAKASNAQEGVFTIEVTVQYIYENGIAGVYTGNVTLPFGPSFKHPDELFIPSSGFLRSGFNQVETTQRASFNFYLKAAEAQSYGILLTYDTNIKHTAQHFNVGFPDGYSIDMLIGDITRGPGKTPGKIMISYNCLKRQTML